MREARFSVRDGDGTALGLEGFLEVFRAGGLRDVEVMSCEGESGVVRVEVEEPIDESRLAEVSGITWSERVARSGEGAAYVLGFDVSEEPDVVSACAEDVVECGSIGVEDGALTFDVAGSQDAIAETIAAYEAAGATVHLEVLGDFEAGDEPLDSLTRRQREVVQTAYDTGYFDVPRGATTADVASELGVDPSTVSEHLQRAERNLLSSVLS